MDHREALNNLRTYYTLDADERDDLYDGVPPPVSVEDILENLGCVAALGSEDEGGPGYLSSPVPANIEKEQIRAMLLEIYDDLDKLTDPGPNARFSLLHGLCKNELLGDCLVAPRDPLKFAHLILYWAGRVSLWPYTMRSITEPDVLPVLNTWLKPSQHWTTTPSVELLCNEMFGPSWWAVRRPDLAYESFEVCEHVLVERVEFRPGVNPGGGETQVMDLPSLG
jgi:hypothetical protein